MYLSTMLTSTLLSTILLLNPLFASARPLTPTPTKNDTIPQMPWMTSLPTTIPSDIPITNPYANLLPSSLLSAVPTPSSFPRYTNHTTSNSTFTPGHGYHLTNHTTTNHNSSGSPYHSTAASNGTIMQWQNSTAGLPWTTNGSVATPTPSVSFKPFEGSAAGLRMPVGTTGFVVVIGILASMI
ncbi:hypothetical protein BT63DRAFT_425363 [Microthyrium microscopicum]|uniref:Uncharacterized protein n=1 Tax=Microthyrium microscopicum TaxID=703497 RepID=A0A6A6UFM1_9PEZI|nr:hypothetical protein BT63DRAFT_425363 [Microthyrium microscopicum]